MNYTQCLMDDFPDDSSKYEMISWDNVDFNYVSRDGKKLIDIIFIQCHSSLFYLILKDHYNNIELIKEFKRLLLTYSKLYSGNVIPLINIIKEIDINPEELDSETKTIYSVVTNPNLLMIKRENIIEYIISNTISSNSLTVIHYYYNMSEDDPELTEMLVNAGFSMHHELYNALTLLETIINKDYLQSFIISHKSQYCDDIISYCFLNNNGKIFNYILNDDATNILNQFAELKIHDNLSNEKIEMIIDTIIDRVDFTTINPELLFDNSLIYKVNLDLIKKAFYVIKNITDGFNSTNLKKMMKIADDETNKFILHELGYDRFIKILGPKINFVSQFYLENDDFCEYYKEDIVLYLMLCSDLDKLKKFIHKTNYELKSDQIVNTTSLEIIKYLINHGVIINVNQIISIIIKEKEEKLIDFILYMINEHDYDVNEIMNANNCEYLPICDFSFIKYLIENCDMDMMNKDSVGSTIFHLYIYYDIDIVKYIVEKYEIDLNIVNDENKSILDQIFLCNDDLRKDFDMLVYLHKCKYNVRIYCQEDPYYLRMLGYE